MLARTMVYNHAPFRPENATNGYLDPCFVYNWVTNVRYKTSLFDFGGTVGELKARCKQETRLEPPAQPQFQQ